MGPAASGRPLSPGLSQRIRFVIEGAIPAALLAFSADALLGNIEKTISTA
jgi:osmoprotectant transport system permease protein